MSKYAGTKTEANLRAAFAGESQARNQYTFFASVAKKEGYEQTAATDLFSLYDFSIRKDAKVEKGYLIGRYGAIPFIKGGL